MVDTCEQSSPNMGSQEQSLATRIAQRQSSEMATLEGPPIIIRTLDRPPTCGYRGQSSMTQKGQQKDGVGERCLACLAHVPCPSLISWIVMLVGIGGVTGGLVYGVQKTRQLLDNETFLWFTEYSLIGVSVFMFLFATFILVVSHVSSEPNSRQIFSTSTKNMCARGMNITVLVLIYLLLVVWILVFAVLASAVVAFVFILFIHNDQCLNLKDYGVTQNEFCGNDRKHFVLKFLTETYMARIHPDGKETFIGYSVACGGALFICISLISFLICVSTNLNHLRDSRFATMNAYENDEIRNSKHSILETTM